MKSVEQIANETIDAKELWSKVSIQGRPWRIVVIETYSTFLATKFRELILDLVPLAKATQEHVEAIEEALDSAVTEEKLTWAINTCVAVLSKTMREACMWMTLAKIKLIDSTAASLFPDVIFNDDGSSYELRYPEGVLLKSQEVSNGQE